MNKNTETPKIQKNEQPNLPEDSFNGNLTAIPKDVPSANIQADPDLVATQMDYGTMNADDARESGYMDEEGHAVSTSREDVEGNPTGAYTDIGAGRSSVVHPHISNDAKEIRH
jgi:hypothetical protein